VLEPCPRGVTEVERQILDDEEIVRCSSGVASKPVVLEPHSGVGVPLVPWHVGQSTKARRELRVADALSKGPQTFLVLRLVAVAVVIAVMAPPASTVVVVAGAIVAVIFDALGLSSALDGVSHVAVGPKASLDHRCRGSSYLPALLMLGRRQIRGMGGRCSCPPMLQVLTRV
jgi:hypothetical protein